MVDSDPRNYDLPRLLQPPTSRCTSSLNKSPSDPFHKRSIDRKNSSPLQSPTDSESVFTDEDWPHNASIQSENISGVSNPRPSDSSADVDFHKFNKSATDDNLKQQDALPLAPPRPPKPAHISGSANYLNLPMSAGSINRKDSSSSDHKPVLEVHGQGVMDEMYDFPRSHQVEAEFVKNTLSRRHCYNNAAPGNMEGQIFRYDISPKPGTSSSQVRH